MCRLLSLSLLPFRCSDGRWWWGAAFFYLEDGLGGRPCVLVSLHKVGGGHRSFRKKEILKKEEKKLCVLCVPPRIVPTSKRGGALTDAPGRFFFFFFFTTPHHHHHPYTHTCDRCGRQMASVTTDPSNPKNFIFYPNRFFCFILLGLNPSSTSSSRVVHPMRESDGDNISRDLNNRL